MKEETTERREVKRREVLRRMQGAARNNQSRKRVERGQQRGDSTEMRGEKRERERAQQTEKNGEEDATERREKEKIEQGEESRETRVEFTTAKKIAKRREQREKL